MTNPTGAALGAIFSRRVIVHDHHFFGIFIGDRGVLLVARYRADIIDSDGHFKNAIYLELADDNSAIETAKRLVNGHGVELWDGHRKMATFQGGETEGAVPVVAGARLPCPRTLPHER